MAKNSKSAPDETEGLEAQLPAIKRVLTLVVLAVLVISVCFNVYLLFENSVLKHSVTDYARLRQDVITYKEMQQLVQRMVGEMAQMAKVDKDVRGLLVKYWRPLKRYRLDASTGATATNLGGGEKR